jgi:hypothetical protein
MPVIEDPHALSSRLIDRGVAPDQARAIAGALHETPSSWATEASVANVGNEVARLRADMRAEFALIRAEMAALPNIILVRMGGLLVVLFGLAVSAIHYLPPVRP